MTPQTIPDATFHTRVRNPALGGDNPFEWKLVTSEDIFAGRRVVVFALPGAFTPACSESHVPGFEAAFDDLQEAGIDAVYCLSVNDAFVMGQWARAQGIEKVQMLPDGNGEFSRKMGMLVDRSAQGMGMRSWRYSMLVEDGAVTALFSEPGFRDNPPGVPVERSGADTMLAHLRG
ncbi:peroxiredoxin [Primorskyibacter aestuariivivens]|uniref:peroxiredoxin n=1 Tax=Primorskyibacter aestuariivivens TaxID=1888912 RepID=UPI002300658D|nr:peroxiredoxin [Primorskyibacter aestuariivivens]MDA7426853.1 peroxiredoxin [Primorskyibacter aestuariivivens]